MYTYGNILPMLILLVAFTAVRLIPLFRRRSTKKIFDPVCGKCGYCVRGIASLTCPECGSDLREVGIVPPGTIRPAVSRNPKLIWTLALPIPIASISWLLWMTVLPFTQTQKVNRTIFLRSSILNTTVQAFSAMRLPYPAIMSPGLVPPARMALYCPTSGVAMDINIKTGAYSYVTTSGTKISKPNGLNAAAIAGWLGPTVNAGDPRIINICQSIHGCLVEIPQLMNTGKFTPMLDSNGAQIGTAQPVFTFFVHDEPSPWLIAGLALFWIMVWLYGLQRIHRRSAARVSTA